MVAGKQMQVMAPPTDQAESEALVAYLDEHYPLGELGSLTHIPAPLEVTNAFRAGYRAASTAYAQ